MKTVETVLKYLVAFVGACLLVWFIMNTTIIVVNP